MNIRQDILKVQTSDRDADGKQIDPEEHTATRILLGGAPVVLKNNENAPPQGEIPLEISLETSVGQIAGTVRRMCRECVYHRQETWSKILSGAEKSTDLARRQAINDIRAALMMTQNASLSTVHEGMDGEMDVEHALKTLGICEALTTEKKELVVTHPLASCPDHTITPTAPKGYFRPRDERAKRDAASGYDTIIRQAQGKIK